MANIVANKLKVYLDGLASTSAICTAFNTTFACGTNLFVGEEAGADRDMLTILPAPGGPPTPEGDRQDAIVQLRLKTTSMQTGLITMQTLINTLHGNTIVCATPVSGLVTAEQSQPMVIGKVGNGKYNITIANFNIKHIKL